MTTTRKPRLCLDCGRKLSASNSARSVAGLDFADYCIACYDYMGWENTHSDEGHDDMGEGSVDNDIRSHCPVCQGNAPTAPAPRVVNNSGTIDKSWSSHAGHDHPATPKARAACRKARDEREAASRTV